MSLRLIQMQDDSGARMVVASSRDGARRVKGVATTYGLAKAAIAANMTLAEAVEAAGRGETVDVESALAAGRVLAPIDHADSAHVFLTGTGLTHLGSADARDRMHAKAHSDDATDSMKMFRMGLEGG
ncbi:MAG TPA: hypothetical protein VKB71_17815, partial [Rhizomicrobium sp.]|nr:hypothetical protein [Rhizomicrobium sp.]